MLKKVFLGVGHGGTDSGAVTNGFKEKDLNLAIAHACNEVLQRHGVNTLMSRTKDENDTLNDEIKECNAYKPDLAIDIHNNAGGGDGAEAFYHYGGGIGKTLAENVLTEIEAIGQNSRGAKTRKNAQGKDYYGFIRQTKAPAIIVECAFVDNATDIQIIDTLTEQKVMGLAIAKGILKTLGIAYVEEAPIVPDTNVEKTVSELAQEVLAGKWGNGQERKEKLTQAGYDYNAVQKEVNKLATKTTAPAKKSNEEIAREVAQGKWGNGATRKKKLTDAGYNYSAIQKLVNKMI